MDRGPNETIEMFDPSSLDVKSFTQLTNIQYESVYDEAIESEVDDSCRSLEDKNGA